MTLVAFDPKDVFNGVNKVNLGACLRVRGIPTTARKWIMSFRSDRHASIRFDDFRTEMTPLPNAGLGQSSTLSPIVFAFFNSDLDDQPVTFHGVNINRSSSPLTLRSINGASSPPETIPLIASHLNLPKELLGFLPANREIYF